MDDFNWEIYVNNYDDLRNSGIDTYEKAYEHWIMHGKNEGRTYKNICDDEETENTQNGHKIVNELDNFDWELYVDDMNLLQHKIDTKIKAYYHWLFHGKQNDKKYIIDDDTTDFDWKSYIDKYEDLKNHGINTKELALKHWNEFGKREKRTTYDNTVVQTYDKCYLMFDWKKYKDIYPNNINDKKRAWNYMLIHHDSDRKYFTIDNLHNLFDFLKFSSINDVDELFNELYRRKLHQYVKFLKYPILFNKYLLQIDEIHVSIPYNISKNEADRKSNWAHLHCYDINNFDNYYKKYIRKIKQFFSVIITYSIGGHLSRSCDGCIVIQNNNRGSDVGAKFTAIYYLNEHEINYNYILFLHSKSNEERRKLYYEPLINNLEEFDYISRQTDDIGIFLPPLILDGDFYHIINDNVRYKLNESKNKQSEWSRHNIIYVREMIKYFGLNCDNHFFPEGNCYILNKKIANLMYSDVDLFGILNIKTSFDYSWVKIFYDIKTDNIFDVYEHFKKNNLYCNNHHLGKGHNGLADAMTDHVFERLVILLAEKYNYKIKIFSHRGDKHLMTYNYDTRCCYSMENYINKCIMEHKFDHDNVQSLVNILRRKTMLVIAAHTNSNIKKQSIVNNIEYFLKICDYIIIVNSIDVKDKKLEDDIKEKYPDNDIDFVYEDNTQFVCHEKWLKVFFSNNSLIFEYDNFILTNDSFLVIKDLYDFQNLFHGDIEETTLIASNEGKFHHTDFLRRYNREGLVKILSFYKENIEENKDNASFKLIIDKFEMDSWNLFTKTNYLFLEKEPVNIHFIEPYSQQYIEKLNYPIIKIKRLQFTSYDDIGDEYFSLYPFDPYEYRSLHIDLSHIDDINVLRDHFYNNGKKEGRKYHKSQKTILKQYMYDIVKDMNVTIE